MVKRTGEQFYELTSTDGVGLRVTGNALNFKVPASIDVTAIHLKDNVVTPITPQMMYGSDSYHQVNIHCFYLAGSSPNSQYTIEVSDLTTAAIIDTIKAPLPTGSLPLEAYYQLVLWVV